MEIIGSIPQWITTFIAGFALWAAFRSIKSQREIARKRAAMDFFFKVEMDSTLLDAYKDYEKGVEALEKHVQAGHSLQAFDGNSAYQNIRNYLNLHELMAVGIEKHVFDNDVCYFYWSGELYRAHRDCGKLIQYIQGQPGKKNTYVQLVAVAKDWAKRKEQDHQ